MSPYYINFSISSESYTISYWIPTQYSLIKSAIISGPLPSSAIECSMFRWLQPRLDRATWSQCSRHTDHAAHADSPCIPASTCIFTNTRPHNRSSVAIIMTCNESQPSANRVGPVPLLETSVGNRDKHFKPRTHEGWEPAWIRSNLQ